MTEPTSVSHWQNALQLLQPTDRIVLKSERELIVEEVVEHCKYLVEYLSQLGTSEAKTSEFMNRVVGWEEQTEKSIIDRKGLICKVREEERLVISDYSLIV